MVVNTFLYEPISTPQNNRVINENYKLPMPTFCLSNKGYNAKVYGALMSISKGGQINMMNNNRYVYKNSFDVNELAKGLNIGKSALQKNLRKLSQLDCEVLSIENTKNGIVYKLKYGKVSDSKKNVVNKYVTINNKMLKEMVSAFDSNTIKMYCLLCYMTTEKDFKFLTNAWLCEQIGLSPKSKNNLDVVTEIVGVLEKCKYIETRRDTVFIWDEKRKEEIPNYQKCYRLCSFEEWEKNDKRFK